MQLKTTPWAHQKEAISRAMNKDSFGLFFEAGAGKTLTSMGILKEWFYNEGRFLKVLIISPVIVVENWKEEFARHTDIAPNNVITLTGPQKKRVNKIKDISFTADNQPVPMVLVTNYEAVLMKDLYKLLMQWAPEVIILDESHRIKTHNSKTTKAVVKLCSNAKKKLILSGTPVLNSAQDLYSQFLALDGGETFGINFFSFRNRYFYDANASFAHSQKHFPKWKIRESANKRINEKIQSNSMRVEKKDCMDLPPLVKKQIKVEMSPEQKRLYSSMEKDFVAYLNETEVTVAQMALTKSLRMQQILTGYMKLDNGEEKNLKDNPRIKALKELLKDLTESSKVIVWAVFKNNYAQIRKVCEELKLDYVEVHGETSDKDRFENVKKFNSDPNCKVFIGHPDSGGIGINLVASDVSVFYSRSYSLGSDIQAEARNYRGGSEVHKKVTRYDILTPGTIDEVIFNALANKQAISMELLKKEIK